MTITLPEITACPSWCTLTPGHPWDSDSEDGTWARGHQGPNFGPFVSVGSFEYSRESGTQCLEINVDVFITRDDLNAADAIDLARELLAAAQWFTHRQREARS